MKPVIIFVDIEKDRVSFDTNEFKKVCDDIYRQGYDDGYTAGKNSYWYCSPTITSDKITINPTIGDKKWWNDISISCTTAEDNTLHIPE